jgi:hypothetical protein
MGMVSQKMNVSSARIQNVQNVTMGRVQYARMGTFSPRENASPVMLQIVSTVRMEIPTSVAFATWTKTMSMTALVRVAPALPRTAKSAFQTH